MADTTGAGGEQRYKIGDVCRIADVQPYVLRYWESEFPVLSPDKSIPGPRTYSSRELKLIEQIKRLLYDEGYTIAGAKKRLESESSRSESKDAAGDTNPIAEPPKSLKPEKTERPEKPEKTEKPRPPRPARPPAAPTFTEVLSVEPRAPEATQPVASVPAKGPADDRVALAVADLKEILALLARSEP